ncbi:hypothetical protein JCM11251_005366 [Rhodosporidiobolus azoricus]
MAVIPITFNPYPDFGPLDPPASTPVTTRSFPIPTGPPPSTPKTPDIVLSGPTNHSGGGPPLLAVVLPVLLGTAAIFVVVFVLLRWSTRDDRRKLMGEEKEAEKEDGEDKQDKAKLDGKAGVVLAVPERCVSFHRHAPPPHGCFIEIIDLPNKPPPVYRI